MSDVHDGQAVAGGLVVAGPADPDLQARLSAAAVTTMDIRAVMETSFMGTMPDRATGAGELRGPAQRPIQPGAVRHSYSFKGSNIPSPDRDLTRPSK